MRRSTLRSVRCLTVLFALFCLAGRAGEAAPITVDLDTSEVPELNAWGEKAKTLIIEWYPRYENLLSSKGFSPSRKISLKIHKTNEGVAATGGGRITVSSHWIEKHPEDIGLVAHELIHIIQAYPSGDPGWVTEGVADYLRWAIFDGKPQRWFPRAKEADGWKQSYRVTGGFFLWLETDLAPGIVRKLNVAMRNKAYKDEIFQEATGKTLPELWKMYQESK